jgi:hypothetical protein
MSRAANGNWDKYWRDLANRLVLPSDQEQGLILQAK